MSPVRSLYCSVCGSFGMLLFGSTALDQVQITTGSMGTKSVETTSIEMRAVDSVDECMAERICIDRSESLSAINRNTCPQSPESAYYSTLPEGRTSLRRLAAMARAAETARAN